MPIPVERKEIIGYQKDQELAIKIIYGVPTVRRQDIAGRGARNAMVSLKCLKYFLDSKDKSRRRARTRTFDLDTIRRRRRILSGAIRVQ